MNKIELQDNAEYLGRVVDPEYGVNPKSGRPEIRLFMEIAEGPHMGRRIKWVANMKTPQSTAYAKRDLIAAGWNGIDAKTIVPDLMASVASGKKIPFITRLARNTKPDGTVDEWWTVGSIGGGGAPLLPPTEDDYQNVNRWFSEAGDVPQRDSAEPPQRSRHPNAPGTDSDVPF